MSDAQPTSRQFRLGVELPDWLTMSERVALAVRADELGFDDACVAEVNDPDAFVMSALSLNSTRRIRLATGVVQIGPRSIPMIASGAATVSSCAPGRFALGIGVSSAAIITGWHGMEWSQPLTRASETIGALRTILGGARSNVTGEQIRSKGYKLMSPPSVPLPIHLAALNKRMLTLAGAEADGAWLSFIPYHGVPRAAGAVQAAAAAAGRQEAEVLVSILCSVTDDPTAAREAVREIMTFYVSSPAYRKAFAWHGYEQEMADAEAAFNERDKARVRACIPNELVDSVAMLGTRNHILDRLEQFREAGITTACFCPLDKASLPDCLTALAPGGR